MNFASRISALILVCFCVACGSDEVESQSMPERKLGYPGPWIGAEGKNFGSIARALGRNSVGGCGEFYYREAYGESDSGEALVYCTRDGVSWTHHLVFYRTDRVLEVAREPGIPLPGRN